MHVADTVPRAFRAASAALAIVALAIVYFWPVLRAEQFLTGDFLAETYPFRRYVTQELSAGHLPHWAPHVGFGFPLLADPEATVFYPVSLLGSWLAGSDLSYPRLQWELVVHYVIAALGLAWLGVRTGLGWTGALVGGCAFAFSGFMWAHGTHASIVQAASWLPWTLVGALALVERPGRRAAVATAVALALSILGGHPQVAYYGGLAVAVVAGVVGWASLRERGTAERRLRVAALVGHVALALVLAGGLVAIQVLPTAALTHASIRWGRDERFLHLGPLPITHLLTVLLPFAFEGTRLRGALGETHNHPGILPVVLAGWALARRRDRWTAAFAAVAGVGLVLALGLRPVRWLAAAGHFRISSRAVLLLDLGVAALAARGADALVRPPGPPTAGEQRVRRGLAVTAAVVGLGAGGLLVAGVPPGLGGSLAPDFSSQFQRFALWLAAAAGVVLVARRLRRPAWATPALILALLVVELLSFPRHLVWSRQGPEHRWPPLPPAAALLIDGGPYRVGGDLFGTARTMENNAGLVYRLRLAPVYSSLALRRTGPVLDLLDRPARLDTYRLVGIKWIAADRPSAPGVPRAASLPDLQPVGPRIWAVPDALPRAYLPNAVRVIPDRDARVHALATLDPRRAVLVDRPSAACPTRAQEAGPGGVEFLVDEPQRVLLRVETLGPGPLVLADTHYPGWRAWIDGAPVPIHQANHAFRMVCVPAGPHLVEFTFQQPGFRLGLALTALAGAAAVALVALPRSRELRRSGAPADRISP